MNQHTSHSLSNRFALLPAFALLAGLVVSPAHAAIQEPAAATPAPATAATAPATGDAEAQGRALMDAAIKAHGGDAFLNMKTLKISGKGEFSPVQAGGFKIPLDTVTLISVAPDRSRLDADSPMGRMILTTLGDKKGGWMVLGETAPRDLSADQAPSSDPTAFLRAAATKRYPVRVVSAAELAEAKTTTTPDGKALQAFEITADKIATRVYVETDTHLVRRLSSKGQRGEASVLLGGYKGVSGVQLPTSMLFQQNGADVMNLTFATLEINTPVDGKLFDRPKTPPAPKPEEGAAGTGGSATLP